MNLVYLMLFTGMILIYIDLKLDGNTVVEKKMMPRDALQKITDMSVENGKILRPMFDEARDIWVQSYEGQKFVDGDLSKIKNKSLV